jgi:hypothetical protein
MARFEGDGFTKDRKVQPIKTKKPAQSWLMFY